VQVVGWINSVGTLTYRKDVKTHGTKRVIEGEYASGQRVLLIEDVVTTGASIVQVWNGIKLKKSVFILQIKFKLFK
jgi:orotate phosphoribosyltransferase